MWLTLDQPFLLTRASHACEQQNRCDGVDLANDLFVISVIEKPITTSNNLQLWKARLQPAFQQFGRSMGTAEEEHGPTVGLSSFEEGEDIVHERQAIGDALSSDSGSKDKTDAIHQHPIRAMKAFFECRISLGEIVDMWIEIQNASVFSIFDRFANGLD